MGAVCGGCWLSIRAPPPPHSLPGPSLPALAPAQGYVLLKREGAAGGDATALVQPGEHFAELALLPELAARRHAATAVALGHVDVLLLSYR